MINFLLITNDSLIYLTCKKKIKLIWEISNENIKTVN